MEIITICTFGVSRGNPGPATIEVQILDEANKILIEVSENIGNATDNFAEYQAVLRGLQLAKEYFEEKTNQIQFELKLKSEFVKGQLNNELQIKEIGLIPHFIEIHNLRVADFTNLKIKM